MRPRIAYSNGLWYVGICVALVMLCTGIVYLKHIYQCSNIQRLISKTRSRQAHEVPGQEFLYSLVLGWGRGL